MPVFHPSARVRMIIRVDERADTGKLKAKLKGQNSGVAGFPPLPATSEGIQKELIEVNDLISSTLNQADTFPGPFVADFLSDLRGRRDDLQSAGDDPQKQPNATKEPNDGDSIRLDMLPIKCSIERKGIHDADGWSIELDWRDVPIDPRVVRACFVEITLGVVAGDEYNAGMHGLRRDDGQGLLSSIVPRQNGDFVLGSTTRSVGFCDTWKVGYDSDNGDGVMITGLDVSALPRQQKIGFLSINLTLPIDKGVSALLDMFVSMRKIQVTYTGEGDAPVPAEFMPSPRKARGGKVASKIPAGDNNMSVWDHITDVCVSLGLTPIFSGFELTLAEPRTLYANAENKRTMVYGNNIADLKFSRNLVGPNAAQTIEVRCYDPVAGRLIWARAPSIPGKPASGILTPTDPIPQDRRPNQITAGGTAIEGVTTMTVKGVTDLKRLERIAENAFDDMGRQEIEGSFKTIEITSFRSDKEGDLLNMVAAEPIELLIAAPPTETDEIVGDLLGAAAAALPGPVAGALGQENTATPTTSNVQELTAMTIERRKDYLIGIGWNEEAASRMSEAMDTIGFNTVFRVHEVGIDWSIEDGLEIECSFMNFIVVRERPDEADISEPLSPEVQELLDIDLGSFL